MTAYRHISVLECSHRQDCGLNEDFIIAYLQGLSPDILRITLTNKLNLAKLSTFIPKSETGRKLEKIKRLAQIHIASEG